MASLSDKQLAFSILKYLKDAKEKNIVDPDSLSVCLDCLSQAFSIDITSEQDQQLYGVCPDLLQLFTNTYKSEDPYEKYKNDSRFKKFIAALKAKNYFVSDNIYDIVNKERLDKAIDKFNAKFGSETTNQNEVNEQSTSSSMENNQQNSEEAESFKEQGNTCLIQKDYNAAIECYSRAIRLVPNGDKSHIYYSNRAAAYMYLKKYNEAIEDCKKSIDICPTYIRAYNRLGSIYNTLKQYNLAYDIYTKGLVYDSTNQALKSGQLQAQQGMNTSNTTSTTNSDSNTNNTNTNNLAGGLGNLFNDPNMMRQLSSAASSLFGGNSNTASNTSNTTPSNTTDASNPSNTDTHGNNENNASNGGLNLGNLSGLLNDPNIRNMAQNVMNNPEMMNNLMSTFGGLFGGNSNGNNNNGNNNNGNNNDSNPNYYS